MTLRDDIIDRYGNAFIRGDELATIALLKELANGGPALELGIGGGRIALPLAGEGIRVDGIEISERYITQLRGRPGGEELAVTQGNYADVGVPGQYRLIYLIWNTLLNLPTQDEQVRCFQNVAEHLTDDGAFLIEMITPDSLYRLEDDQYVHAESVALDEVRLDVARYDRVGQVLNEMHVSITRDGAHLDPHASVVFRYAWPTEIDLMARLAGLQLKSRWGGWNRQAFTSRSPRHISVYGR